jgi:hypothetical protein
MEFEEQFIFPKGSKVTSGPDDCSQFHSWVSQRGAIKANDNYLRVVLQGRHSNAVLISSLRARIVERRPPLAGIPVTCAFLGGGEPQIRFIRLDLDRRPAVGVHAELDDNNEIKQRKPFGFTLKKGETEIFDIWASTGHCYCKWLIELDLVVNGTRAVKTISYSGQPFQTTAMPIGPIYSWERHSNRWHLNEKDWPRNVALKPLR